MLIQQSGSYPKLVCTNNANGSEAILGLAGYYRRFIEGFSLISKPLSKLTHKNKKYKWGMEEEKAFQTLKQKLCSAPILALPEGTENFIDLIESALNSKLLSINSNSQRLDKKEQEVKNVVEQPAERGTRVEKSLKNFRVIHKSSISLNNTSQISLVYAVAPILSIEEPEHSLSMRYEHLNITPETESDKVIESNAKNLLPIPSECEVTSEDENKCDMPAKDDCSPAFTTFSNPLFNDNDDLDSSDNESLPEEDVPTEESRVYSNPLFDEDEINSNKLDPHCFNVESDFVKSLLNRDTFIDSSSKFDFSGELAHVNLEITEFDFDFEEEIHLIESLLYDNSSSRPPEEHNAEEERIKREHAEYISHMEMLFTINPRPRPTVNANTIVESLPTSPIPVQDSDSQREEIDIVTD
nr:reverse transcriptase domain-containing protein [Tanacetum cinerariifolium]